MRIVTIEQMKEIERRAAESGLSYKQMMENAGCAIAELIKKKTKNFETKIILICVGKGNNGGDGYVAARRIKELGAIPLIIMAEGAPKSPDAKINFELAKKENIEILTFDSLKSAPLIYGSDVIIDAVYGTGFRGELSADVKQLFEFASESDAVKYAVDVPSGINADGLSIAEGAFKADYTVAIDSLKNAHILADASEYCGNVVCVDIGIPENCH